MPEGRYSTYAGQAPQYRTPKYDGGRLRSLAQEQLAPTISRLGRQIRGVQTATYANPMERRQAIRGAVRGYGEALAPAQAQATRTAQELYQPEYQAQLAGAQRQYQQQLADYTPPQPIAQQSISDRWQQWEDYKRQFLPSGGGGRRTSGRVGPGTAPVAQSETSSFRPGAAGTKTLGYPQDWRTPGR